MRIVGVVMVDRRPIRLQCRLVFRAAVGQVAQLLGNLIIARLLGLNQLALVMMCGADGEADTDLLNPCLYLTDVLLRVLCRVVAHSASLRPRRPRSVAATACPSVSGTGPDARRTRTDQSARTSRAQRRRATAARARRSPGQDTARSQESTGSTSRAHPWRRPRAPPRRPGSAHGRPESGV